MRALHDRNLLRYGHSVAMVRRQYRSRCGRTFHSDELEYSARTQHYRDGYGFGRKHVGAFRVRRAPGNLTTPPVRASLISREPPCSEISRIRRRREHQPKSHCAARLLTNAATERSWREAWLGVLAEYRTAVIASAFLSPKLAKHSQMSEAEEAEGTLWT
jgi:hypothetical protein